MAWEVDWANPLNTGTEVSARNTTSRIRSARPWHMVKTGYLRRSTGIKTPVYRKDSWEVDWNKRKGKLVWARNEMSKIPSARAWHWVDFHTLVRAGLKWQPKNDRNGRYVHASGYAVLTRRGMTEADVELSERLDLFKGSNKGFVREHHLVAAKKYGRIGKGMVVRHINGIKDDNRPENLLLGTVQENTMDHNRARLRAMYWRERCEKLQIRLNELEAGTDKG